MLATLETPKHWPLPSNISYLLRKAPACCAVMAAVDVVDVVVVASVVPSAAGPPPSAAATPTCAYVGTAAACARGLSCAAASGAGWAWSQPACAATAPAERRPAQVNGCARAAAGSAGWVEAGATARRCELDWGAWCQRWWASALRRPPAGLVGVAPRGCPRCHAMGVKGRGGAGRAGGGWVEARAEAGVRRMEAGWGVRTGEAAGFLEEVALLGCSVSMVAGVEHCGSLQTVRGQGWRRTDVFIFRKNKRSFLQICLEILRWYAKQTSHSPKTKKQENEFWDVKLTHMKHICAETVSWLIDQSTDGSLIYSNFDDHNSLSDYQVSNWRKFGSSSFWDVRICSVMTIDKGNNQKMQVLMWYLKYTHLVKVRWDVGLGKDASRWASGRWVCSRLGGRARRGHRP